MTKLVLMFTSIVVGLVACSGPGPRQPKMSLIAPGPGWSCMVNSVGACFRDQNVCNVDAFKLDGAAATPCVKATTATCMTFKQAGTDKLNCFSVNKTCQDFRQFMAKKGGDEFSICKDMD